jgi:oxygen-independent coproporphyrinogen-3 oxidase
MNRTLTPASLELAARNVPRYTSYPTAPHFTGAVGAATCAEWLAMLPPAATLSVYIHVPFCVELCHYCGCTTKAARRREPVDAYAAVLRDEIALLRGLAGRRLTHLHWGGGTPSILGAGGLASVVESLAGVFDFNAIREHAIELDPRRVDRELVRALAALGVTRASLGVQTFAPHVQQAIGRIQPFDLVERVTGELREAGIEAVNFDLMYGLPKQTAADVERSAVLADSLRPDRIALFGYAHVPWFRTHQRIIDTAALPGVGERLAQAEIATDALIGAGYAAIGLDHFALPGDELARAAKCGTLRRNFQGYTTDSADALIGLGASAIGQLPQGYVQNAPDTGGYSRAIANGTFATVRGLALSDDDRTRGAIIERLMCDLAADLGRYGGARRFADEIESLGPLADAGFVTVAGDRIAVTERGRPFVRIAAAAFDAYLPQGEKRHSVAV